MIDRILQVLGRLPTTNARIAVTLVLFAATGIVTLATNNLPGGWDWAVLLLLMSGLDATSYIGKRATFKGDAAAAAQNQRTP